MKHFGIVFTSLIVLLFVSVISCDTEDPFALPPPDFSSVPEPYDTAGVELTELENGVRAYIHEEGSGPFTINARDQVSLYLTLRTDDGENIYSTFSNDRTDPITVTLSAAGVTQNVIEYSILLTYTPGFKIGLLGMKEGGRRTLVVPPELGYQDVSENNANSSHRDNTLIYDILVSSIGPKKSY